jgi:hypothetical protein
MLLFGFPITALAIVLYGAGMALDRSPGGPCRSHCSVPIVTPFDATPRTAADDRDGASPFLAGVAFQKGGADWTLSLLAILATINVTLVIALKISVHTRPA